MTKAVCPLIPFLHLIRWSPTIFILAASLFELSISISLDAPFVRFARDVLDLGR
jgi:hypothetical protein